MYQDGKNEYGCPLLDQSGAAAVRDFDAMLARLSPELRAAFEAERAARQRELRGGSAGWGLLHIPARHSAVRQLWLAHPQLQAGAELIALGFGRLRHTGAPNVRLPPAAIAADLSRYTQVLQSEIRRLRQLTPAWESDRRWAALFGCLVKHGQRQYAAYTAGRRRVLRRPSRIRICLCATRWSRSR